MNRDELREYIDFWKKPNTEHIKERKEEIEGRNKALRQRIYDRKRY